MVRINVPVADYDVDPFLGTRRRSGMKIFHVGLDDTDSREGMCTTFLTYNLVKTILGAQTRLIDYPNLIRLNPNIPWKTRGNASLVLRIETRLSRETLFNTCKAMVDRYATSEHANAGLVILEGAEVPGSIKEFAQRALCRVLSIQSALKLIAEGGAIWHSKRNGQGLVGALAGIGNQLEMDYTFELIAYRRDCNLKRRIERSRIVEMDRRTRPSTFNCYDEENDRVLIMPHGPDPVLLGIRGETPRSVKRAFDMLHPVENLLGYMIFRSNQGTGEHLQNGIQLSAPKAFTSGRVEGKVSASPEITRGGHVFFSLRNAEGEIACAAYEPTGHFRKQILSLIREDEIEAGGGVRKGTSAHPKILNLEYIIPRRLAPLLISRNPRCPRCMGSTSSEGRNQGYRCRRCNFASSSLKKSAIELERELVNNKLYLPDLKAHRHLTKPLQRYGLHTDFRKRNDGFLMPLTV